MRKPAKWLKMERGSRTIFSSWKRSPSQRYFKGPSNGFKAWQLKNRG